MGGVRPSGELRPTPYCSAKRGPTELRKLCPIFAIALMALDLDIGSLTELHYSPPLVS